MDLQVDPIPPAYDLSTALAFGGMDAGLLAISVGILAFVPVLIEMTIERTSSADDAVRRSRHSYLALDVLLGSVVVLGTGVVLVALLVITRWQLLYNVILWLTLVGDLSLLVGVSVLGLTLRKLRSE